MNRRQVIAGLGLTSAAWPTIGRAQQATRPRRIGVLLGFAGPTSTPIEATPLGGLLDGMRERGYLPDRDFNLDRRYAATSDLLGEAAAALVDAKVDLIVAASTKPIAAAQAATTTIPNVLVLEPDPVASGFAASLSRPGRNITGVANLAAEWGAKRLELLLIAAPHVSRLGALVDRVPSRGAVDSIGRLTAFGDQRGLSVSQFECGSGDGINETFAAMAKASIQAVTIVDNPPLYPFRRRIADLAIPYRMAFVATSRDEVVDGALMSYGQNIRGSFKQAASYIVRIFEGATPGDLPIEQPTHFELILSAKTAKAIGLTISDTFLARADEVIE